MDELGDSVKDIVGLGETTADLGRVVIIVIVLITMIRMTWKVWRMLKRTGGWLRGGTGLDQAETWQRNTG